MPFESGGKLVASVSSGHTAVASGPLDICKTPAPPAPVPPPLPYPNTAMSATMGPGYATKTMRMTPIWTDQGKTAISNGMQPGVALNIISNKIMGMCAITMASNDVGAEGGGLVRTGDMGNSNT